MKRTVLAFGGLALLSACAGASPRNDTLGALERESQGPLARQARREAPAAYAEYARALEAARTASSDTRDDRIAEAQLTLAWVATQARIANARARTEDADRRTRDAEADTGRMDAQTATLLREVEARENGERSLAHARTASSAPTSVIPADRLAAAADTRQQTELDLAAAALLGATDAQQAPVRELLRTAETAAHGNDPTAALVAAGRAFSAAETLVRNVREGRPAPENATSGARLVTELSDAGGFDPHRDERGVIAVMHGLFAHGTTFVPAANTRLQTMARVIQSHADARVRVEAYVGGADRARAERTALAQAQAVVGALVHAGVPQDRLQAAGLARVDHGARPDDRVEIVLVLPTEP
jgi:hypothetical protein